MKEMFAAGRTLPEAYHSALKTLDMFGDIVPCPDYNTKQKELTMTIYVSQPLAEPMISKLFIGGPRELEQYRQEILDGILDFEIERGNWAYTYHSRMAEQIPFIINELRRNPDSRRAVIDVRDWQKDAPSSDPACLQHIQFFIRDSALHCKVLFRSNDACKAAFMNAFALIMLQKRIADELHVPVGSYTHRANSFHCYEKDFSMLEGYVRRMAEGDVTYCYKGEWDELMEEARPDIARAVAELKGALLRPCPFCGGKARMAEESIYNFDPKTGAYTSCEEYWVSAVCSDCGASTRPCDSEEEAMNVWNGRADNG